MAAIAHSPEFAKKTGIPQSVGKDFYNADKAAHKFASGGSATAPNSFRAYAQQNLPIYSQMAAMQARAQEQEAQFKQALAAHYADHPEDAPQQTTPPSPKPGQMQQMQQMQQLGTPNAQQTQAMQMHPMGMSEGGIVAGDTQIRLPMAHVLGGAGQKHIREGAMFHPHFGPRVRKFADGGEVASTQFGVVDRKYALDPHATDMIGTYDPSSYNPANIADLLKGLQVGPNERQPIPPTFYTKSEIDQTGAANRGQNRLDVARGLNEFQMHKPYKPRMYNDGNGAMSIIPFEASNPVTPMVTKDKYMFRGGRA